MDWKNCALPPLNDCAEKAVGEYLNWAQEQVLPAALMADDGHHVVAVELSPIYANYAREHLKTPRIGTLEIIEADFYTVELAGRFDVVCYWDGFGVGSDADHRCLLQRIARHWLAPNGYVLMDVFSPIKPARDANTTVQLDPLDGVPELVKMNRRCHFDPLNCRWIDEWEPVDAPDQALAQTVRCYTPVDFLLLLEGTHLTLKHLEVDGEALDFKSGPIVTERSTDGGLQLFGAVGGSRQRLIRCYPSPDLEECVRSWLDYPLRLQQETNQTI